ncbi:hypothetical protein MNBD_BACTEROID06-849 [hydrothermal vent metagenome]|uniref:Uncharacterized protein n=1 Tax=hydrothermal vent metagenome TaxID=652676 RepID=A0A3B0VC79_9ZZZZ
MFLGLFLRKKANKSESTSIHIISKTSGKYKVIKTVGCAQTEHTKKKYSTILKKTNSLAENFNAKIKTFRATFRDLSFFLYRVSLILASRIFSFEPLLFPFLNLSTQNQTPKNERSASRTIQYSHEKILGVSKMKTGAISSG